MPASPHMLVIGKRRKAEQSSELDQIFPAERADFLVPHAWSLQSGRPKTRAAHVGAPPEGPRPTRPSR